MNQPKNRILILGQARSGSTYLKNCLNDNSSFYIINEPLAPGLTKEVRYGKTDILRLTSRPDGGTRPHMGFPGKKGMSIMSDEDLKRIFIDANGNTHLYWEGLWKKYLEITYGKYNNIGMKLFWNHQPHKIDVNIYGRSEPPEGYWLDEYVVKHIFPKFNKFVLLRRPLKEFIFSRVKSLASNIWGTANRFETKEFYPTWDDYASGLCKWSGGSINPEKSVLIKSVVRYHVGAELFANYVQNNLKSFVLDYNNIDFKGLSNYLETDVHDSPFLGYKKIEYDIDKWLKDNDEFQAIYEEVQEKLFQLQKQDTF